MTGWCPADHCHSGRDWPVLTRQVKPSHICTQHTWKEKVREKKWLKTELLSRTKHIYLQIKGSHITLSGDTKCWNNICRAGLNLRWTFIYVWEAGLYITVTCAAAKSAKCFNLWLVKQCEMCRGQGLWSEARVQQQFTSRNKTRCFVFLAKCSARWYSTAQHQWKN